MIVAKRRKKPDAINADALPGEDEGSAIARVLSQPEVRNAVASQTYALGQNRESLDDLRAALEVQTMAAKSGDLSRAEEMLTSQAHTLDAIFTHLAYRAMQTDQIAEIDMWLKMGLRAQSQSRATWETLSTIQNPPVVYAKQANIAQGHQQVNYGVQDSPTRKRDNQFSESQLLEKTNGERLDFGTTGTAGAGNTPLETVGTKHRTKNGGR